ncbi:MAG: hypothetical protein ACOY3Y_18275 [Acidobacteriota bacterium]
MGGEAEYRHYRVPFSQLDVFAYLIPGATFLLLTFLFEFRARHPGDSKVAAFAHTPVYAAVRDTVVKTMRELSEKDGVWSIALAYLLILMTIAYVAGHVVSSVSSFLIDRILVAKGYGYPYLHLLGLEDGEPRNPYSGPFYKAMFFWMHVYFVVRFCGLFLDHWSAPYANLAANCLAWCLVLLWATKVALENARRSPRVRAWLERGNTVVRCLFLAFRWTFIVAIPGLYDLASNLLAGILGTKRQFSRIFCQRYSEHFKAAFHREASEAGSDNFWLCRCFIAERAPVLNSMAQHWLYQYQYSRNLSSAFFLAFLYSFVSLTTQFPEPPQPRDLTLPYLSATFLILSVVMLTRYYYLYVSYYSKFVFRSFVYLCEQPAEKSVKGDPDSRS